MSDYTGIYIVPPAPNGTVVGLDGFLGRENVRARSVGICHAIADDRSSALNLSNLIQQTSSAYFFGVALDLALEKDIATVDLAGSQIKNVSSEQVDSDSHPFFSFCYRVTGFPLKTRTRAKGTM